MNPTPPTSLSSNPNAPPPLYRWLLSLLLWLCFELLFGGLGGFWPGLAESSSAPAPAQPGFLDNLGPLMKPDPSTVNPAKYQSPTPPPANQPAPAGQSPTLPEVFRLHATKNLHLPPAMYGVWDIRTVILKSDAAPWMNLQQATLIWSLSRSHGIITLQNLMNRATATVSVDQVKGNTATFHHKSTLGNAEVIEIPTLTVNGDYLNGVSDKIVRIYDRSHRLESQYRLLIQINGHRLSGGRVEFGDVEAQPDLQVDPVRRE